MIKDTFQWVESIQFTLRYKMSVTVMINVRILHHGGSFGLWRAALAIYFPI